MSIKLKQFIIGVGDLTSALGPGRALGWFPGLPPDAELIGVKLSDDFGRVELTYAHDSFDEHVPNTPIRQDRNVRGVTFSSGTKENLDMRLESAAAKPAFQVGDRVKNIRGRVGTVTGICGICASGSVRVATHGTLEEFWQAEDLHIVPKDTPSLCEHYIAGSRFGEFYCSLPEGHDGRHRGFPSIDDL